MDTLQNTGAVAVSSFSPSELLRLSLPLAGAFAIFLVGWLVATIAAGLADKLLRKTKVDSHLANSVGLYPQRWTVRQIGKALVFWVVFLLGLVAALNALNLTTVSTPLNSFLDRIFAYLPSLGAAIGLTFVAWALATVARLLVFRTADSFGLDDRLEALEGGHGANPSAQASATPTMQLSRTLGNVAYGFVFLFFLPLILGVLQLQGPLAPVQNLLSQFLAAVPSLFKAVVIAAIGWFIAKFVQDLVTRLLVDRWHAAWTANTASTSAHTSANPSASTGLSSRKMSLSRIGGLVVFTLILIPTAIAVLDALALPSVTAPATAMLNQVLTAVPLIATAAVILAIGYYAGTFVASFVTTLLDGVGFNSLFRTLGVEPPLASGNTPSRIMGVIAHVAMMMVATVTATSVLNIDRLSLIVAGSMVISGKVLVGLALLGFGLYLANSAKRMLASSGDAQAKLLGQAAQVAILGFALAISLQQMGIAPNIISLAFGLLLGSMALALGLAFGLGGRDVAARQLEGWVTQFKGLSTTPSPAAERASTDHQQVS
jgi:hypothetical protein